MRKMNVIQNNRGSILVGAVALAMLMAIAGAGFLLATSNGINSETAAFENEKAFQAAESGVWIGTRWLRDPAHNFLSTPDGTTLDPFGGPVLINGLNVVVKIPVQVGANGIPVASITANVYSGTPGATTFKKRITVGKITNQGFGTFCTFYDGYQPTDCKPSNWDGVKWLNDWGGWGNNRNFYGRTHLNNMPVVLNTNGPRFFGPVTVSKNVTVGLGAAYANGQRGNDYSAGVLGALQNVGSGYSPSSDLTDLNAIFVDRYTPNVDPVALDIPLTDAVSLAGSGLTITNLPFSSRDDGYGPYQYRPTLYINGTQATYYYRNGGGAYDSIKWGSIDGRIFVSKDVVGANTGNNLNIYTSRAGATGRFTIATATSKSIVPVGNITTSDYDFASGTIPSTSDNMIGLISGGFIAFNKTWIRWNATLGRLDTPYVSVQAGGLPGGPGTAPGLAGKFDTLHMSASIIAVDSVTSLFDTSYTLGGPALSRTFTMKGTEWWDGMWGPQHPTPNDSAFSNRANKAEDYSYQLFGNHILAAYARSFYGNGTRGCLGSFVYKPDPRMINRNLQPPGFPGVRNKETGGVNLLTLVMRNWSEENSYSP
jgi:hypothetical protein